MRSPDAESGLKRFATEALAFYRELDEGSQFVLAVGVTAVVAMVMLLCIVQPAVPICLILMAGTYKATR